MSLMRAGLAAAALSLGVASAATSALASPPQGTPPAAALTEDHAALAALLADPALASAFLAEPDCLERLAALSPAQEEGAFDAALAALAELLALDEIRPRAQLALGVLNHHLGRDGAARGYALAALASGALPAEFRQRAETLLGQRPSGRIASGLGFRLSGTLTAGLHHARAAAAGAIAASPEDLAGENPARDLFVQLDMRHHIDPGLDGFEWESALQAQTTRVFDRDAVDASALALSGGPRIALPALGLDALGLDGSLRLLGGVEFGTVDERLDSIASGGSLLLDQGIGGGSFSLAVDWRQRRYRNSAASPDNDGRSGREVAARLGYDFRLAEWMAGSASARYADYRARRASDSYAEWQVGLTLNSDALPALAEQAASLVSTQWHLGLFGEADAAPSGPGFAARPVDERPTAGLALWQGVSFVVQGGFSRRDTALPTEEDQLWYGRTGLAWQF